MVFTKSCDDSTLARQLLLSEGLVEDCFALTCKEAVLALADRPLTTRNS